jgi:hypothetical protein
MSTAPKDVKTSQKCLKCLVGDRASRRAGNRASHRAGRHRAGATWAAERLTKGSNDLRRAKPHREIGNGSDKPDRPRPWEGARREMSTAALVNALALPSDVVLGMGHFGDKRDIAGKKGGPQ